MSNVCLRGQLRRNLGKIVKVHPEGNYANFVTGNLERISGEGLNTGWYVEGMQIPIREIESAMPSRGVLDIGVNPDYFEDQLNKLYST